jgi:hypothetical protein
MLKCCLVIFAFLCGCLSCAAEDLQWNRYVNTNFVILSIDDQQGKLISESISDLKSLILKRWGFSDISLKRECRIFCVPNKNMLKKLFSIDSCRVEIREELSVIWLDTESYETILPIMTEVVFAELEKKYHANFGFWFQKGSSLLAKSPSKNKEEIIAVYGKNEQLWKSHKLFSLNRDEYNKLDTNQQQLFDYQSMIACLMLRKEFGELKLHGFLQISDKNVAIKKIYGFKNLDHFDKQYFRFVKDFSSDVKLNKTPDNYLKISARK